jgi:hypothetical protein
MIIEGKHRLAKIGRKLKNGEARIVGRCSDGIWPDEPHFYIIEDLVEQETHHVKCSDRSTWAKYIQTEK